MDNPVNNLEKTMTAEDLARENATFDSAKDTKDSEDNKVKSEKLRYENADDIYE